MRARSFFFRFEVFNGMFWLHLVSYDRYKLVLTDTQFVAAYIFRFPIILNHTVRAPSAIHTIDTPPPRPSIPISIDTQHYTPTCTSTRQYRSRTRPHRYRTRCLHRSSGYYTILLAPLLTSRRRNHRHTRASRRRVQVQAAGLHRLS